LPGIGGLEVIQRVRSAGHSIPILILTAKDALQSRVGGLNAGADDYLTKPFEIEELEARLRALLRRSSKKLQSEVRYGPLSLDQNTRMFALAGAPLHLSPREHAILETLLRRAGAAVSKEVLLESTYGFADEVNLSAIEVNIHRLRKKLEPSEVSIATLRGLGYLLRLAGDLHRSGTGALQTCGQGQRGRFPAAGRADDSAELSRLDHEVNVVDGGHRGACWGNETLRDLGHFHAANARFNHLGTAGDWCPAAWCRAYFSAPQGDVGHCGSLKLLGAPRRSLGLFLAAATYAP